MTAAPSGAGGVLRASPGLALGLFGVSWSAVLVRLAGAPAATSAWWRILFSLALVVPLALRSEARRSLADLSPGECRDLAASGVCLGLHLLLWFAAVRATSVASATVLVSATPVFVAGLSAAWLGERPGGAEWVGIGVAAVGSAVVGASDAGGSAGALRGDGLALAAAVAAALYFVLGRRLRPRLGLWAYVAPVYVAAAVVSLAGAAATGSRLTGYGPAAWACFLGMAAGPMLLGHTSFNWALGHVRAYVVSLVMLLEPLTATVIAILVLGPGEVPSALSILGAAALLGGVALVLRARARPARGAA
ncbi:MAG TPA: DMT family transporter [Gemmatimonadota bacterium]|nr:DMT family transporter [Gemmatimonadota bacterium]